MSARKIYDDQLLRAINDWQAGSIDKVKKAGVLRDAAQAHTTQYFRACAKECYRVLDLSQKDVFTLFKKGRLPEAISSWTVDLSVAEKFRNGIAGKQGFPVIITRRPSPEEIVLNLDRLHGSKRFQRSIGQSAANLKYLKKWMNSQREVILAVNQFTLQEDIQSWGGRIGSEDQLKLAARETDVPEKDIAKLPELLQAKGIQAGDQWWLSRSGAAKVIIRVLERAHKAGLFER